MGQIITSQFNVATVEKGENSIYLDLSNDNDSILYIDGAAKNTCVTTITLYDGAKDVTAQAVVTHTATGCTVTKSGRTYTVTAITGESVKGTVLISAAYNGQNYSNTFTITKLVDKDRYELICSPNSVTVNTTTGAKSASAIKVEIYKTPYTTGIRAKLNTLDGGHSLKYYVNNGVSPTAISYSGGSGSFNVDANNSSYRVVLASGNVELDSETIPINKSENGVDGEDGKDGNGIVSITNTFALSAQGTTASETTAPSIVGSWSTTEPTPTDTYPYLWRREVTVYTDTTKNTTKYFLVAAKGKDGTNGQPGHIGRWYEYYGDVTSTAATLSNTDDHGWFIKKGDYFYMLITDSGVSKSTTTAPSTATSNEFWDYMGGDRKYYIGEAFFGDYAHLGSFVINGDWMISQYGYLYVSASDVRTVNTRDQKYGSHLCYTYFKPSDPTCTGSGSYPKFAPSWAVDGLQGKQYHNGRSGGKAGYTAMDDDGFSVLWGGEGIKVGSSGLQRYDDVRQSWLPMFNKRNIVVDSSKRYSRYTLPSEVDYFVNAYAEDNYDKQLQLPSSSSLPDGAVITVRGLKALSFTDVYPATGDILSIGDDYGATFAGVDGADRVDFVLCKALTPPTWFVNYYDRTV